MDLKLKGKRVLVTGGSKGIGKACAQLFAEEGCEVMIASRDAAALQQAADEIRVANGTSVKFKAADLSQRGVAEALSEWAGTLDILVNNAGAIPGGDLLTVDEDTWRSAWDLKVFGYINLCRAVYRVMKERRQGVIVNVLGVAGERLAASYIAGSTANAGLMAFTRALGGASHKDGIRVVGVSPGPVATDRLHQALQAARRIAVRRRGPLHRILQGHGVRSSRHLRRNRKHGRLRRIGAIVLHVRNLHHDRRRLRIRLVIGELRIRKLRQPGAETGVRRNACSATLMARSMSDAEWAPLRNQFNTG